MTSCLTQYRGTIEKKIIRKIKRTKTEKVIETVSFTMQ